MTVCSVLVYLDKVSKPQLRCEWSLEHGVQRSQARQAGKSPVPWNRWTLCTKPVDGMPMRDHFIGLFVVLGFSLPLPTRGLICHTVTLCSLTGFSLLSGKPRMCPVGIRTVNKKHPLVSCPPARLWYCISKYFEFVSWWHCIGICFEFVSLAAGQPRL